MSAKPSRVGRRFRRLGKFFRRHAKKQLEVYRKSQLSSTFSPDKMNRKMFPCNAKMWCTKCMCSHDYFPVPVPVVKRTNGNPALQNHSVMAHHYWKYSPSWYIPKAYFMCGNNGPSTCLERLWFAWFILTLADVFYICPCQCSCNQLVESSLLAIPVLVASSALLYILMLMQSKKARIEGMHNLLKEELIFNATCMLYSCVYYILFS